FVSRRSAPLALAGARRVQCLGSTKQKRLASHPPRTSGPANGFCPRSQGWRRPRRAGVSALGNPARRFRFARDRPAWATWSSAGGDGITTSNRAPEIRVNERIRVPQVRVIGDDGSQVGVVPVREALAMAQAKGLDLVEVSPTARPPVCRIMD